jgi:cell division protein FtsB
MKKINLNEKKIIQGLIILCSVVVFLLSFLGDKGYFELHKLKQKESAIEAKIESLKKEKQIWLNKIHSIKNNRTYFETYAREQLGYVKNYEYLIRFTAPKNE